jgi:hypothetical protein
MVKKLIAGGVKIMPPNPPLIEGEAAQVTNGVARSVPKVVM